MHNISKVMTILSKPTRTLWGNRCSWRVGGGAEVAGLRASLYALTPLPVLTLIVCVALLVAEFVLPGLVFAWCSLLSIKGTCKIIIYLYIIVE